MLVKRLSLHRGRDNAHQSCSRSSLAIPHSVRIMSTYSQNNQSDKTLPVCDPPGTSKVAESRHIRNQTAVNEDTGLELHQVWTVIVSLCDQADFRPRPGMNGELKACACFQAWDEARHDRHNNWTMALRKFGIWDDTATDSELLERCLAVPSSREQQNVPVVVSHDERVGKGHHYLTLIRVPKMKIRHRASKKTAEQEFGA